MLNKKFPLLSSKYVKNAAMIDLDALSFDQILELRFKDLKIQFSDMLFLQELRDVEKEIKSKDIPFKAHYWVGEEWFSPDGITGISVPFYLFHPKLIKLHKKMVGEAEGATTTSFKKYLRHEYAHALDNGYQLRKNRRRQRLFGLSSTPYPEIYDYNPHSSDYVQHLAPHYAQAHPEEDWAETFAVWLKGTNVRRYKGSKAGEKIELLANIFSSISKAPQYNKKVTDSVIRSEKTLKEFYQQQRAQLYKYGPFYLRRKLKPYLKQQGKKTNAYKTIKLKKASILKELNKHYPKLQAERFYKDILSATKDSPCFFNTSDKDLLQLLVNTTIHYVKNRRHRIVM